MLASSPQNGLGDQRQRRHQRLDDLRPLPAGDPPNPYTSAAMVASGDLGSSDWYYDEVTSGFRANDDATHAT